MRRRSWALFASAGLTLMLVAGAHAQSAPSGSSYRIGPKDLLEIKVLEAPELNVERRVEDDGSVVLPRIGAVEALGLTEIEFADRLRQTLEARYFQRATVEVRVREYRSRPITVIGAVKSPGNLAFSGRWTLLEALAAAGGVSEGHGDLVYVLRRADNGLSDQVAINLDDLLVRADPRVNIPIFANDLINVPATTTLTIFFLGEVSSRGAISFRSNERVSLLSAVARAGGLTDRASRKVVIKRRSRDGTSREIAVDFKRVLSGKDPDPTLEDGDVVVVKESFL